MLYHYDPPQQPSGQVQVKVIDFENKPLIYIR